MSEWVKPTYIFQLIHQTFIVLHTDVPGQWVVEVQLWEYLAADALVSVAAGEDDLVAQSDDLLGVRHPPLDWQEHLVRTFLNTT